MPNTTNYNWATPADTDLVKDGAAAIRTLGSSADTTVKNLNPGTTAGDIDYYTSSTAKARVAIGTALQVLRVNSGGTAPEWATPAAAALDFQLLNAGGTALTAAQTITISGISNKNYLFIYFTGASSASASTEMGIRLNADTGNNYNQIAFRVNGTNAINRDVATGVSKFNVANLALAANTADGYVLISGTNATGIKVIESSCYNDSVSSGSQAYQGSGYYSGNTAITSVSIFSDNGNFDAGTIYVYGA